MARITGAKCRICRRLGTKLFLKGTRCDSQKCPIEKENKPPGVHGAKRVRLTEFGIHLREVQRAKKMYGVMQRQFRRYYDEAIAKPGNTGEYLMQILERRLDNVVYRLRMGSSRPQARQMILHGHIRVNGKKVSIPSYQVDAGDVIEASKKDKSQKIIKEALLNKKDQQIPSWLKLAEEQATGTVVTLPTAQELQVPVESQLIVEYMSR
ncbi:MAG TPA: 30S ribosomal protein S4 [Planctomycetota bacterium]|jgi:small subunit ribosomal protein S4|nr:30S ribosomal protein S4 [Planctomycetota bacterium]